MPERSSISQVVQIGVEATSGVSVAASKKLQALGIEPSMNVETSQFRPMGTKYQTLSIPGKEWVEASLSGRPVYDEIIYPLSSVLTTPGVTGAGAAKTWLWTPSSTTEDTPKTFTVEQGSGVRAHKFLYGLVTAFSLSFTRDAIEMGGSMMGRAITDNIAMTGSPTSLPLVPVVPSTVCVYLDDTYAGLGGTRLTRLLSADWEISDRFGPLWTIDCTQPSYVTHVETEPSLTFGMMMEADAQGMGLLETLRDGDTKFLRIEATGPLISGSDYHRLRIDMPIKITGTDGFSDSDGVYAVGWNAVGAHDSTFLGTGGALRVEVINTTAAL